MRDNPHGQESFTRTLYVARVAKGVSISDTQAYHQQVREQSLKQFQVLRDCDASRAPSPKPDHGAAAVLPGGKSHRDPADHCKSFLLTSMVYPRMRFGPWELNGAALQNETVLHLLEGPADILTSLLRHFNISSAGMSYKYEEVWLRTRKASEVCGSIRGLKTRDPP